MTVKYLNNIYGLSKYLLFMRFKFKYERKIIIYVFKSKRILYHKDGEQVKKRLLILRTKIISCVLNRSLVIFHARRIKYN